MSEMRDTTRMVHRDIQRAASGMLVLCQLLSQGCVEGQSMPEHTQDAWLDSPEVLRVAFHPRKEGPSRGAAGFEGRFGKLFG